MYTAETQAKAKNVEHFSRTITGAKSKCAVEHIAGAEELKFHVLYEIEAYSWVVSIGVERVRHRVWPTSSFARSC